MEFIKKNKILVIVIVVIALGLGVFVAVSGKKQATTTATQEKEIKKMAPGDIGLTLSMKPDGKAVIMKITKLEGIKSLEYEVSYDAEVTDEGQTNNIPRGVVGSPIEVNGKTELEKEITLGTCSANVCKYDKVTSAIKFVIKVNLANGEVGSIEDSINPEK